MDGDGGNYIPPVHVSYHPLFIPYPFLLLFLIDFVDGRGRMYILTSGSSLLQFTNSRIDRFEEKRCGDFHAFASVLILFQNCENSILSVWEVLKMR